MGQMIETIKELKWYVLLFIIIGSLFTYTTYQKHITYDERLEAFTIEKQDLGMRYYTYKGEPLSYEHVFRNNIPSPKIIAYCNNKYVYVNEEIVTEPDVVNTFCGGR